MRPELSTHTLLKVSGPESLAGVAAEVPAWVAESLRNAPWVVVRRAPLVNGFIPVGVRGSSRHHRYACWLFSAAVVERVTPQALVLKQAWVTAPRRSAIPAIAALEAVSSIMYEYDLGHCWGPGGSVGFELASGCPAATRRSDLDLVVATDIPLSTGPARALLAALQKLPVRADVLLEMPYGAVALSEYTRAPHSTVGLVLRTTQGPKLIRDAEL